MTLKFGSWGEEKIPKPAIMGSHVVLGEGDRDKAFLRHLCNERGIAGLCFDCADGINAFGNYLLAMSAAPGFSQCQAILLMIDCDEPADDSWGCIRNQLRDIDFPMPAHPLELTRKKGKPTIAVLMQPHPIQGAIPRGCLETLLIPAMSAAHPVHAACVDEMLNCAGVANWTRKDAQDKAKVRSLISVTDESNPARGLHLCFSPDKGMIPMNDAVFDETALVLAHFPAWSSSETRLWSEWRREQGI